ncbi:MAG: hypothetical protein COV66_07930 [Nitrospinae bacterium CG11_big_fil_rev_8_21_14_0_20_45_15]|nr:MAG: hypothetical protein COV66_07930 [Nitrospinae bacterium CG11_big_fil_rev_8_21_14_0_20_45_15]
MIFFHPSGFLKKGNLENKALPKNKKTRRQALNARIIPKSLKKTITYDCLGCFFQRQGAFFGEICGNKTREGCLKVCRTLKKHQVIDLYIEIMRNRKEIQIQRGAF